MSDDGNTRTAYGLDLAGYSSGGKTALVRAHRERNVVSVEILEEHGFLGKANGDELLEDQLKTECQTLRDLDGEVYVDVPIELDGLMEREPDELTYIWQVSKRPVDYVFDGMPPLASLVGAIVGRFRMIYSRLCEEQDLADRFYETYPKASLELMGVGSRSSADGKSYKGKAEWRASFRDGQRMWRAAGDGDELVVEFSPPR